MNGRHVPMTKAYGAVLEQQIKTTVPGMAHWANSGPFGAVCGECVFWSYYKIRRTTAGDEVKTKHVRACAKYRELTGKHGAVLPANTPSCRYFTRREEEK
jgi:hypothetical protein